MAKDKFTVREAGKAGGEATKAKLGQTGYKAIGRSGGQTTAARRGPEYMRALGAKGGQATSAKHGPDHYREMGKAGGQKIREICARAREAEAAEGQDRRE